MDRLNLAIPTRRNSEGLRRCVNSALALAEAPERIDLYLHFSDDHAGYDFCPEWPRLTKLKSDERRYYYAEANELFQSLPLGCFVWTDDDSEFVRYGWDSILLSLLRQAQEAHNFAVLEFFPGEMKHFISHSQIFHANFDGYLYPKGFVHFCGDSARAYDLQGRIVHTNFDDPNEAILTHPSFAQRYPEMLAARKRWWNKDRETLQNYVNGNR